MRLTGPRDNINRGQKGRQATGETGWDGDRLAHNPATASVALLSGHDGGKYAAKSELRAVVGSTFTQVEAAVGIP